MAEVATTGLVNDANAATGMTAKQQRAEQNKEQQRLAQEAKARKKQETAERIKLAEEERQKRKEEQRKIKEANIEKMRLAKEAKEARRKDRQAKIEEQRKLTDEASRLRADSTVVVTVNQQSLLEQVKGLAENSSEGAKVEKISVVSIGNMLQLSVNFASADHARAFIASNPKQELTSHINEVRPKPTAKRTCYFPFDCTPHGTKQEALQVVREALKNANIDCTHASIRGHRFFVIEFGSEEAAASACERLNKGACTLGSGVVIGEGAAVGNTPRQQKQGKKRKAGADPDPNATNQ